MNNLHLNDLRFDIQTANIELRSGRGTTTTTTPPVIPSTKKRMRKDDSLPDSKLPKIEISDPLEKLPDIFVGFTPGNCRIIRLTKSFRTNLSSQPDDINLAVQSLLNTLLSRSFPKICSKDMLSRKHIEKQVKKIKYDDTLKTEFLTQLSNIEPEEKFFINPSSAFTYANSLVDSPIKSWFLPYVQNKHVMYSVPLISNEYFKETINDNDILYIAYQFNNVKKVKGKISYIYTICSFVSLERKLPDEYLLSLSPDSYTHVKHRAVHRLSDTSKVIYLSLICAVPTPPKSGRIMTIIENDLFKLGIRTILLEAANKNAYDIYKYFNYIHLQNYSTNEFIYVQSGPDNMALMEKSI
jgi:hypothetical protein